MPRNADEMLSKNASSSSEPGDVEAEEHARCNPILNRWADDSILDAFLENRRHAAHENGAQHRHAATVMLEHVQNRDIVISLGVKLSQIRLIACIELVQDVEQHSLLRLVKPVERDAVHLRLLGDLRDGDGAFGIELQQLEIGVFDAPCGRRVGHMCSKPHKCNTCSIIVAYSLRRSGA